jgi:hypothetical protein
MEAYYGGNKRLAERRGRPKDQDWAVPASVLQNLDALTTSAESALDAAKNETTRTPVSTARCREAFDALAEAMRDMKRRYFLSPPLTDADYVALGITPRDATHTPNEIPTAQVTVETYLVGRHELGVKIVYVTGSPTDPANKGYRIMVQRAPACPPRGLVQIVLHPTEERHGSVRLQGQREDGVFRRCNRERRQAGKLGSNGFRADSVTRSRNNDRDDGYAVHALTVYKRGRRSVKASLVARTAAKISTVCDRGRIQDVK